MPIGKDSIRKRVIGSDCAACGECTDKAPLAEKTTVSERAPLAGKAPAAGNAPAGQAPVRRQTAQNVADTDRRVRLGCIGAVGSGAGSEARVRACRHGIRADQCFPRGGGKGDRTRGRCDL